MLEKMYRVYTLLVQFLPIVLAASLAVRVSHPWSPRQELLVLWCVALVVWFAWRVLAVALIHPASRQPPTLALFFWGGEEFDSWQGRQNDVTYSHGAGARRLADRRA